jgi:hypothetical protein
VIIKVNADAIILLDKAVIKGFVFNVAFTPLIIAARIRDDRIPKITPRNREFVRFAPIMANRALIKVSPSKAIFKVPEIEVIIAPRDIKNRGVNKFNVLFSTVIIFFSY